MPKSLANLSLSELLADRSVRATTPVCYADGHALCWPEFRAAVSTCAAALAQHSEQRWCVVAESSYAFAVGFIAALQAKKTLVFPPNAKLGTVLSFQSQFSAILADSSFIDSHLTSLASKPPLPVVAIDSNEFVGDDEGAFASIDSEAPQIELYTSGTSGTHKCVTKCFHNFEAEIAILEQQWGTTLNDCVVVSTVPHLHIYGLLYKVLWPLLAGRPFIDRISFYPNELAAHIEHHKHVAVISSPAHLKRFCEIGVPLSRQCQVVISSGGLLTGDVAQQANAYLGSTPIEVLGSTETGGVAWRQQENERETWQALPEVKLRFERDCGLQVYSQFIGPKSDACWAEMGDGAEQLSDGRFKLLPRRDRICKVEDRRFSPTIMERQLVEHEFVSEAAVVVVQNATDTGGRTIVAAALVPSTSGFRELHSIGRKKFIENLRSYLENHHDAVLLPKRWRFLSALPSDERGKRPLAEVEQLFDETKVKPTTMPELLQAEQGEEQVSLSLKVPDDLAYFPGHFPQQPVVPGFVQVDWVMTYARQYFALQSPIRSIEALKFQSVLLPNNECKLEMQWSPERQRLQFSLKGEVQTHASGRIHFS